MEKISALPLPPLPVNPGDLQYFWYMLPVFLPGFLTFFVGLLLSFFSFRASRNREQRGYFFTFGIFSFSAGILGLTMGLRAIINDEVFLLAINNLLYYPIVLLAPAGWFFLYYASEKRYSVLQAAGWVSTVTVFIAFAGLLKGDAFTGTFYFYTFGKYPVSSWYLTPWGVFNSAGVLLTVPAVYWLHKRKKGPKIQGAILLGFFFQTLLFISDLPALAGVELLPLGILSFIPMSYIAYSVFRADFTDMRDLLYRKHGLFYTVVLVLGSSLLVLSVMVVMGLSPHYFDGIHWYPWTLIPLVSGLIIFILGIQIAGANPHNRLNQMGALSLLLSGFYILQGLIRTLHLDPLVTTRINQFASVIFALSPAIQLRFIMLWIRKPVPMLMPLVDILSLTSSFLAITPLYFDGYYSYSFGQTPAAGPGLTLFIITSLLATAIAIRHVTAYFLEIRTIPSFLLFLYPLLTGVLLAGSVPALYGYPFYSLGNLLLLPTLVIAVAVYRYRSIPATGYAMRIINRLSIILFIMMLFLLLLFIASPNETSSLQGRLLHLVLALAPGFLFSYLLMTILTRPLAIVVDKSYRQLRAQQDEVSYDLSLARTIQTQMIPEGNPDWGIAAFYKPMTEVGGDFFDFITFREQNKLGIFISDVSGHGIHAALITTMIKSYIQRAGDLRSDPSRLLHELNDFLMDYIGSNFVTALYGIYDYENRKLLWSNAGHPLPLVLNSDGITTLEPLNKATPLGLFSSEYLRTIGKEHSNTETDILPDSLLLMHTDGLTEAFPKRLNSNDIAKHFFEQPLHDSVLPECRTANPQECLDTVIEALTLYRGSDSFNDDICLICMKT